MWAFSYLRVICGAFSTANDLLEDITYMIGREGSFSKLVFTLKDEQVMVAVQSGSDLTEIAHDIAIHLTAITAHN